MEQEGGISSREYHKCMSEVYLTRALLWILFAAVVFEMVTNPAGLVLGIINSLLAIGYLARWRTELRMAQ